MAFHLAFSKPVLCPDEWGQEEGCNPNMFIVAEVLQKLANAESDRSQHPGHPKN